jgi:hypothetical protein
MSSDLARHAGDYLKLRRALGHDLADAARLLPRFVTHSMPSAHRALQLMSR